MEQGKKICNELKKVRRQIAEANGIAYSPTECHHKGNCAGTCPACEAEVKYLEHELSLRSMLGKAVVVAGLGLSVASCTNAQATRPSKTSADQSNCEVYDTTEAVKGEIPLLVEGKVPAIEESPVYQMVGEVADIPPADKNFVYRSVDEMPVFPGGEEAMMRYLAENVRYPEQAAKDSIQGRVIVQFVVKDDGTVGTVKVVRSVNSLLDAEAVRVVKSMPKFIPGKINGIEVSVWYILPVAFKIEK